jgi:hypothetical protein
MKASNLFIPILLAAALAAPLSGAAWQPVAGTMLTRWGRDLDPAAVWQEYPRPQLQREAWTNLNGLWDYAITAKDAAKPAAWDGKILVPFAPEAALSGVGRLVEPDQALWYRRELPAAPAGGGRVLLHFEAVDYETTVWVNGQEVGSHRGGHTPIACEIGAALGAGPNELVVRVFDATSGYQLHGKQTLRPGGIWYTRVTGIWQTVWLEPLPARAIRDLDFLPDIATGTIQVKAVLDGTPAAGESLHASAYRDGAKVAEAGGTGTLALRIPEPRLWSPGDPALYDLVVELRDGAGATLDQVKSYAALREFGKTRDANGNLRFTLNGKPVFHWGPLDQGWWPDGLLTPPSDAAMRFDIEFLKQAGFNMIRKHIKVEPRRYYYHLDRLGLLMWQDQVSQGYGPRTEPRGSNPLWTRLAPGPQEGEWPDAAHRQWVVEYRRMVDHLRDHPCIAVWVPFNEAWGQHRTMEVGKIAVEYDRTRHVNVASGGNFWPVGDIADEHSYPHPAFPLGDERFNDYVKVVGEFGGHGWPVKGHLWQADRQNWGYGGLPRSLDEWKERYARSLGLLAGLRKRGIAGAVYTQTTDVEVEINGLLTYDRIPKIDAAWLKQQSDLLLNTPDCVRLTPLAPTSELEPQDWRHLTSTPPAGWEGPDFDASAWPLARGGFGTRMTPNSRVGTEWNGRDIWLRREFTLAAAPKGVTVLRIYHDEDAVVFLNGKQIAGLKGFTTNYTDLPLAAAAPVAGRNVLAIHCRQTEGGQFIDAGLYDETPLP